MSETMEEILANCMERMETGVSLEACLAEYPAAAAELEPLLRMTQQMKRLTKVAPRPAFAQYARTQLEDQLVSPRKAVPFKGLFRHTRQEPGTLLQKRSNAMGMFKLILATVLAMSVTTATGAYAANASNPGDVLHGLDLAMENVQLNLTSDVSGKVQLRLEFASERLAEAQATFANNDVADGQEAVNEYGAEISAATQLIGGADGANQEALTSLLQAAQGVHQDVLTQLLATVPDQAKDGIQQALDASKHHGKPDDIGNPNDGGKPNGSGNPAKNPNKPGNPNDPVIPTGVPAGPPSSVPGGPPDHVPGKP